MTDRPSSSDSAQPGSGGAAPGSSGGEASTTAPRDSGAPPHDEPPGLRPQFGRTKDAVLGLIAAHVDLAKAEFSEIAGEIKRAAALGGIALAFLMLAGLMLSIGGILWLDDAMFHGIGWGVIHGTELYLALTVLLVLAIVDLGVGRAFVSLVVGIVFGAAVGVVLAVDWKKFADSNLGNVAPEFRAVLAALVGGAIVLGILGIICAALLRGGRGVGVFVLLLAAGVIVGILVGAFAPNGTGPVFAVAVAVAIALLIWPIYAAILVFRHGIDTKALKDRFLPDQTIETTKETIEWVRAQTPLGRKS